jgi:hypothetical protein
VRPCMTISPEPENLSPNKERTSAGTSEDWERCHQFDALNNTGREIGTGSCTKHRFVCVNRNNKVYFINRRKDTNHKG